MKKLIFIFFLVLSLSVIFFFTSSGAKAGSLGDAKKGLDSILHLKTGPMGQKDIRGEGNDHGTAALPEFHIPLSKNLKVFLGIVPPSQDSGPQDSGSDVRAALGFHIPLK